MCKLEMFELSLQLECFIPVCVEFGAVSMIYCCSAGSVSPSLNSLDAERG